MTIKEIENNFSGRVVDRFIKLCDEGKIFYNDQLKFYDYLNEKYKPTSISDFSRLINKNYKIVQEWVFKKIIPYMNFAGRDVILKSLVDMYKFK